MQFVGGLFALYGIVLLWRNASRGSYFDPVSGHLHWWHSRTVSNPGIAGKIHPKEIKCIILIKQDSREDEAILIGPDDFPISGFDANAIPWRNDIWARQLVAAYPHIALEERS